MVVVLGPGGIVWVVPTLLPAVIAVLRHYGVRRTISIAWPLAVLSVVFVLPVIFTPTGIFNPLNGGVTASTELGNLTGPLNFFHVAGLWPAIDFREDPHLKPAVIGLAALCLAIAAATMIAASRRGERDGVPLVGYVGGGALGALVIAHFGSPWVDGKAMATISPALLAAALIGIAMLGQRTRFRFEALALGTLVAGVVAWSAFLAYQGVSFAPRAPNLELERIGERFAGEGPALSTEVSIFGPRHFLRKLDAEGASDRRRRLILLRSGAEPETGHPVDLDEIQTDQLDPYNLLVVRRSPSASRPPANFGLAYQSKYYDVWRRREAPGTLIEHMPLGTPLDAGDIPSCADVRRLAAKAGDGGELVAARVDTVIAVGFPPASLPSGWTAPSAYTFSPSGSGTLSEEVEVPGGEYELWLGGTVYGGLELSLDGKGVASERAVVENSGAYTPLGAVELSPGRHRLQLDYSGASLWPGSALHPSGIGPLLLEAPVHGDLGTVTVRPADYRRLCGRRWDWIEAYGP
jgi:hypothetical protein